MNSLVLKNIGRFIVLWGLQILILNYLQLPYGMQLYIYILFILLLPYQTPHWLLLILAFCSGLSIDVFTGILGVQAAAATLMGFTRIFLYHQNASAATGTPTANRMGWSKFISRTSILIFVFHSALFFLEIFTFQDARQTLWLIVSSSGLCLLAVMLSQLLFTQHNTLKN